MDTRRDFLKKAGLLSGMAGLHTVVPASIQKALAIEAAANTTWKDAEHIVILMQENRSFDHCFGTLKGVRGFNDPRAIQLPNGNPVWLQSNKEGETYAPFRLDIKNTKSTWMHSLPHSWDNQVNARNDGRYDEWLNVKKNSHKDYANMPLTMGYYDRQDIPFYYELADAFTVCDQHFCSSLTGTTPNRLYFWTGTIRAEQHEQSLAHVWNEDADYESLHWKTFPEILEENNVSWKFYQNELSIDVGFKDDQEPWLSNFGDNPLEFFSQYNIKLHGKHLIQVKNLIDELPEEIASLEKKLANMQTDSAEYKKTKEILIDKKKALKTATKELEAYHQRSFDQLSVKDQALHQKAFVTNINDPHYHSLEEIVYEDGDTKRALNVPKGDLLHQFRDDVNNGKLPTVSWLAAPENLSDHPASAWYGAWYVSEVMDILTKNPEVWKKTIFILTYDENDGYFDHVPPFTAPHSGRPDTGKLSAGLDTRMEFVTADQGKERTGYTAFFKRESPIGLGFRVPMIVASPWSRGGYVNSEVFDHTSTLQFLEKFLMEKNKKPITVPYISEWRRVVSGDLTSIFRPSNGGDIKTLNHLKKDPFLESIYTAKFKELPKSYTLITPAELKQYEADPETFPHLPVQEKGVKPSNALNYQLYVHGKLNAAKTDFEILFEASDKTFGKQALGSPFNVYAPGKYLQTTNGVSTFQSVKTWAYAVRAADIISDNWALSNFENKMYHLNVYGPNGFFRSFKGTENDPAIDIFCNYQSISGQNKLSGNIEFLLNNKSSLRIAITDNAYKRPVIRKVLHAVTNSAAATSIPVILGNSFGWYDFTITVEGYPDFSQRFAGRVETGSEGYSDPYMGRVV